MKVLNLYAGLGGNRQLWDGVEVTAVEMDERVARIYQQQFPQDTVIVGDAHQYLLDNYDAGWNFIWASPPCQSHSRMMKATRHDVRKYPDMKLYQEIILLQHFFDGKWVVENVVPYYSPLLPATKVGRHLFWSNFTIRASDIPTPPGFIDMPSAEGTKVLKDWLGIQYDGNLYLGGNHCPNQALRNCVHPILGEQVFNSSFFDDQHDMFGMPEINSGRTYE